MEQVIESMVAVVGDRAHVEAAVEDEGIEAVAQAIESGHAAGLDLAELFGGEA